MIDLRSDTLTKPTPEMRQAMAMAEVGDDVFGEDPTVRQLEAKGAELLGQEAALFCVSGSMANLLGLWLLVEPGAEVVCDSQAHIVRAEMGAHARLHGVSARTWTSPDGVARLEDITPVVSLMGGFLVPTAAIEVENTMNFASGAIQPLENLREIAQFCEAHHLGLHLDGARLGNACVATGDSLKDYAELATTVTLCLSKGLGAPIGTLLASSATNIARARVQRKRLGGGWRQAGMLAAAGIYALDHHLERLGEDNRAAAGFADEVRLVAPWAVAGETPTNIVVVATGRRTADEVLELAETEGLRLSKVGAHQVRAVAYLGLTLEDCQEGGRILAGILAEADPR